MIGNIPNPKKINEFMRKLKEDFLPELQRRLDDDPKNRGGKIIYAGNAQADCGGIDIHIEDKNGTVSIFNVNPITESFAPVTVL